MGGPNASHAKGKCNANTWAMAGVTITDSRVTLFNDIGFGGTLTTLTSSCASLVGLGINDTTSSLVVEEDPLGQVVAYSGTRFTGTSQVFGPGRYDLSALTAPGPVGNDAVSSSKVPPNWTVVLYQDAGFSGTTQTLTADSSDLGGFSDQTSSLIITPG